MAKADRLQRMDARRVELEAQYRETLVAALHVTAGGSWGLFNHKADRVAQARAAPVVAELDDLAAAIDDHRQALGLEGFSLHHEFLAARGPVASNEVGEPKQAQAWLDRLTADAVAAGG